MPITMPVHSYIHDPWRVQVITDQEARIMSFRNELSKSADMQVKSLCFRWRGKTNTEAGPGQGGRQYGAHGHMTHACTLAHFPYVAASLPLNLHAFALP